MPGCLTHWHFSNQALNLVPSWVLPYRSIVLAASQGTDPFFFCGKIPWRKRAFTAHELDFGSRFHARRPIDLFMPLLDAAFNVSERAEDPSRDEAFAFVYGLLLHWHLDRHIHPYVFSQSGFDAEGGLSPPWNIEHTRFEFLLDSVLSRFVEAKDSSIKTPSAWASFHLNKNLRERLSRWLSAVFPGETGSAVYAAGLEDMGTILRVLGDKSGIKRALFKMLGLADSYLYVLIHPSRFSELESERVINGKRLPWPDPVTGAARGESFFDLYDRALGEIGELIALMEQTRDSGYDAVSDRWNRFYRDTNHDGLLPGAVMRYNLDARR